MSRMRPGSRSHAQGPRASWPIEDVWHSGGLSPTRFAECFRSCPGESVMAYLAQWRLTGTTCRLRTYAECMGVALIEAVRLAFESLRASKLRSALTLLGVMLSTATLIAVMAIIHGMDVYVASSASTMGTDGFRVLRAAFGGYQDAKKFFEAQQKNPQLTQEEYEFVKDRVRLVGEAGISGTRLGTITYSADAVPGVAIQGVTSNAAVMSNTQVDLGRFFTDIDDQ